MLSLTLDYFFFFELSEVFHRGKFLFCLFSDVFVYILTKELKYILFVLY